MMTIKEKVNIDVRELELRRESIRMEKITNSFRIVIVAIGVTVLFLFRSAMPIQSLMAGIGGMAFLGLHALVLVLVTSIDRIARSRWFVFIRYVSACADIITVSMILWGLEGFRTFRSAVFAGYFIFIGLGAYRYSRSLTVFTALMAVAIYWGMFIFAISTDLVVVGSIEQEYFGGYVSLFSVTVRSIVLVLVGVLLSATAKGYSNVNQRVVNREVDLVRKQQEVMDIRSLLRRYFSQDVAEYIMNTNQELRGERKEITIMFCDLRNFTQLSESLPSEEVVSLLNSCLSSMVDIVFKHNGTLDKYTGDGFMAVFGAPIANEDDVTRAIKTALDLQEGMRTLNKKHRAVLKKELSIGIGMSTGEAIVGNIGSEKRLEYTVIGRDVNLASRLEKLNKKLKSAILISDSTYQKVVDQVEVKPAGKFKIQGIKNPIEVYELLGLNSI